MREMIGRCGFRCDACMAFVDNNKTAADQTRVAEAWSKYFGLTVPPEQIRCNGCLAADRGGYEFPDKKCPIAPCVVGRGLENCAFCAEYPCEKLEARMHGCDDVIRRFRDAVHKGEFDRFIAPYDSRSTLNKIRGSRGMISFSDIQDAFMFVNSAPYGEHTAVLRRDTGQILYRSEMGDLDEIGDEDLDGEMSIAIPHKNDLDLGQRLVFGFVETHLPDQSRRVHEMFRSRGAYGRFRDFLESKGLLERWYTFENERQEEALRFWCQENGIHSDLPAGDGGRPGDPGYPEMESTPTGGQAQGNMEPNHHT